MGEVTTYHQLLDLGGCCDHDGVVLLLGYAARVERYVRGLDCQ